MDTELKNEPELEARFDNIMNELQTMKTETKCGTCKEAFTEMIETGERYKKVQEIVNKMEQRGYKSWSEVPNDDKKKFKDAVGLNITEPITETTVAEEVIEQKEIKPPAQQLNRAKFLKAFKFPARV